MEQQLSAGLGEREVAQFVQDQEVEAAQEIRGASLAISAGLTYKTIHASKGLQADHVVLLAANSGKTGFPSEIVNDPLLNLVSPEAEPYENAEEQRVMYVAMTRARYTLTILASNSRPSSFVTELKKEPGYGVAAVTDEAE